MTAEKFLMADPKPPIDEEEIREAVWELLFSRAAPCPGQGCRQAGLPQVI